MADLGEVRHVFVPFDPAGSDIRLQCRVVHAHPGVRSRDANRRVSERHTLSAALHLDCTLPLRNSISSGQ